MTTYEQDRETDATPIAPAPMPRVPAFGRATPIAAVAAIFGCVGG
jgi:hypothetical protein